MSSKHAERLFNCGFYMEKKQDARGGRHSIGDLALQNYCYNVA
jgi:hypothetical protein